MKSLPKVSYVAKDEHALVCHIVPERAFDRFALCGRAAPRRVGGWYFIAETPQVIPQPPHVLCASCEASVDAYKLHARR